MEATAYDIVIIGAGPAGSTLARLIDSKYKVAVIDKKCLNEVNFEAGGFKKPCGGLLAPDAQKALARFNLTLPLDVLVDPQIFAVKTVDINSDVVRHYQRFYLNLDRHKFDLWLMSLIPSHVDLIDNARCTSVTRTECGYEVVYSKDGCSKTLHAKYIAGADGAASIVRRTFFKRQIPQYISIQEWYKNEGSEKPLYSAFFDDDLTQSYGWSITKGAETIYGAALPLKNSRKHFELLKTRLKKHGYAFNNLIKTEACLVSRPMSLSDIITGCNGVFLIGEAGGFISPSSLEGISYAFDTAYALGSSLNKDMAGAVELYKKKTLGLRLKLFGKMVKMPFMYNRALRKLVMKSGITSIKMTDNSTDD